MNIVGDPAHRELACFTGIVHGCRDAVGAMLQRCSAQFPERVLQRPHWPGSFCCKSSNRFFASSPGFIATCCLSAAHAPAKGSSLGSRPSRRYLRAVSGPCAPSLSLELLSHFHLRQPLNLLIWESVTVSAALSERNLDGPRWLSDREF